MARSAPQASMPDPAATPAEPVAADAMDDRTNPPPGSVPPGAGFYRWDSVAGWVEIPPGDAQRPQE